MTNFGDEKEPTFLDDCAEVRNDPEIAALIKKLEAMEPPQIITSHNLNQFYWKWALRNHPDKELVAKTLDNVDKGWTPTEQPLVCSGMRRNYEAALGSIRFGLKKLIERLDKNYVMGPYASESELPEILENPTIWGQFFKNEDKIKDGKLILKRRLLTDFSDESMGVSFNDCLTQAEKTTAYPTIPHLCKWILDNNMVWLWSMDAYEAYYRVPVRKQFMRHLGFRCVGFLFFFTCLVMGMASACKLYTEFADIVCWIIIHNSADIFKSLITQQVLLKHYIDDFIGGAPMKTKAQLQFRTVKTNWNALGIPANDLKCISPTRKLAYLGYIFNTWTWCLEIPQHRIRKYTINAEEVRKHAYSHTKIRNRILQSLVGQFRSLQMVYPYIIPFLRSWESITSRNAPNAMVRITPRMLTDLKVIEVAVNDARNNTMPMRWIVYPRDSADFTLVTDAATTLGVGGYQHKNGGLWYKRMWADTKRWSTHKYRPDIVFMELLGVVAPLIMWAKEWKSKAVHVYCDNSAVVSLLISKCACFRRPDLNALLAKLATIAIRGRFYVWIDHIEGAKNKVSDNISRNVEWTEEDMRTCAATIGKEPVRLAREEWQCTAMIEELLDCFYDNIEELMTLRHQKAECSCDMDQWRQCAVHKAVNEEPWTLKPEIDEGVDLSVCI